MMNICVCGEKYTKSLIRNGIDYDFCQSCGEMKEAEDQTRGLPCNDKSIVELANIFGIKHDLVIPSAYLEFAGKRQSYAFSIEGISVPKELSCYLSAKDKYGIIDEFADFKTNGETGFIFITNEHKESAWGLPDDLVPIEGDGHTWFVLDYRSNRSDPKVVFFETDDFCSVVLAENFSEFAGMLIPYDEVFDRDGEIID